MSKVFDSNELLNALRKTYCCITPDDNVVDEKVVEFYNNCCKLSNVTSNIWMKKEITEESIIDTAYMILDANAQGNLFAYLNIGKESLNRFFDNNFIDEDVYSAIKHMNREELSNFINKVYKQGRLDNACKFNNPCFENGSILKQPKSFIDEDWDECAIINKNWQIL